MRLQRPVPRMSHSPTRRRRLCAAVFAACAPVAVAATTTTWIDTAGGDWEDAANWNLGVPGPTDTAVLRARLLPGAVIVVNAATQVGAIDLFGSLDVRADMAVAGTFAFNNDTGVGPAQLRLANRATVQVGGQASLPGAVAKRIVGSGTVEFVRSALWGGNGAEGGNAIVVGDGSATLVRNRGSFVDANAFGTSMVGSGSFDNAGDYLKTGAGTTSIDVAGFTNRGAVTVQAGRLDFVRLEGEQLGRWQVDSGAEINVQAGTSTWLGTIGGTGRLRLSGGHITIEGFGRNLPTTLDGATLDGRYTVFDGPFTWRSGTFAASGATLFTGPVDIGGPGSRVIESDRQLLNYGTMTWGDGDITMRAGTVAPTTLTNLGEFRSRAAGQKFVFGVPDGARFVNAGSFVQEGSGTTRFEQVEVDNTGTIDVQEGRLQISGSFSNTGVVVTSAFAALRVVAPAPFVNAGTVTGDGTIEGSFVNRGRIAPGRGIGRLTTGALELAADGRLEIELGADGMADLLQVGGPLQMGGALEVVDAGAAPWLGQQWRIVEFAPGLAAGSFESVVLRGFSPGVKIDLLYGERDLRLVVTAVPEAPTAALWLTALALAGAWSRRRS